MSQLWHQCNDEVQSICTNINETMSVGKIDSAHACKLCCSFLMKILFYFIKILTMVNILAKILISPPPTFQDPYFFPIFVIPHGTKMSPLCLKIQIFLFRIYVSDFIENCPGTVQFGEFPYFVRVIFGSRA